MIVETKEIVTLTREEKKAISDIHILMLEILEAINEPDIYNATKQICDGLEDFESLVDTKV